MKKIFLFFFIIGMAACSKKDSTDTTPKPTPTPVQDNIAVSSISPDSGAYSTIVTITGSGFNTTASSNVVEFNGKTATINSATATQLVVVVPAAAGTGNVTVAWGSKTGTGPVFNFAYTINVSTFCGSGTAGFVNGSSSSTQLDFPTDLVFDSQGNLYVADAGNACIRKITTAGISSTFAGTGTAGTTDGNGSVAQFDTPSGLAIDNNDNLYVADQGSARIRKITPSAVVSTLAGSTEGFADGNGTSAQFNYPTGLAVESNGNLYIADQSNHRIRKMNPSAVVSTLCGSTPGFTNGSGALAQFYYPTDITLDGSGNILVADYLNHAIRKVTSTGVVTTLAGNGISGSANGTGNAATFSYPLGIAVAANGMIYVGDEYNHLIRQITPAGVVTTIAGIAGTAGFADGAGSTAKFSFPSGIAIDANGDLYVVDISNNRIRKITIQ
jgi:sugar lactone lactonase YvrE